jgi:hypothetical protein
MPEADQGAAPFAGDYPIIEVEGVEYEMIRLGWDACWTFMGIVGDVYKEAGVESSAVGVYAPDGSVGMAAMGALLSAASHKSDRLLAFTASTIKRRGSDGKLRSVDPGEVRDAERFPMYFPLRWLGALADHPDWALFFVEFGRVKDKVGRFGVMLTSQLTSKPLSTESNARPAIPINI